MPKPQSPMHRQQLPGASAITHEQLSAIQEMRTLLLEVGNKIEASNWTTEQAVEILEIIAEGISPLIDTEIPNEEKDFRLIEQHATTGVLKDLAVALRDLKYGSVDERLKSKGFGGSAYTSLEKDAITSFLFFVDFVRGNDKSTFPAAEKKVAQLLGQIGTNFQGKGVTAKNLSSWRRAKPGVKRYSQ